MGYNNVKEVYPRPVKEEFRAIHSWNNHSFLIKKSESVSFSIIVEEKNQKLQKKN